MKIYGTAFAFLLLFISSEGLSYEYDFSPMEDDGYYNNDDNYYYNNGNNYRSERPDYYKRRYKNNRDNDSAYSNAGERYIGGQKTFVFDPKNLSWYAYHNGKLVNSGRASGGRFYCADIHRPCKTPVGVFTVGHKGGADCKSSKYPIGKGNAPMPYCMFFRGGFAIHGSWQVPNYNASHGCIRVPPPDARWLNKNFLTSGSRVIVKSYR